MNKAPVFVFGTPEGGSADVTHLLRSKDYKIVGNPEYHLKELWDFVDLGMKTKSGFLGPGAGELLKRMHFPEDDLPDKFGFVDNFVGMNFGYGFRMWKFLISNIPESKLIFAYLPLTTNLARVLAMNKKWIPSYGSCWSNCEQKIDNQITQFEEFARFYPANVMTFNIKSNTPEQLYAFIK